MHRDMHLKKRRCVRVKKINYFIICLIIIVLTFSFVFAGNKELVLVKDYGNFNELIKIEVGCL